jgi:hypothetical protein
VARTRSTKPTVSSNSTKKHTHKPGGKAKAGAKAPSVTGFLAGLNKTSTKKGKKKSDKPVITLDGRAKDLLRLQQVKALAKSMEGEQKALEADLFPEIEEQRVALNLNGQEFIGSLKVQATGKDEKGNDIEAGVASYYISNRFSPFNYFESSTDDELQEEYEGEASLKTEALHAIVDALADEGEEIELEAAETILDDRMEVTHSLSLDEGVLACNPDGSPVYPEKIAILQEHFGEFLRSVTKAKPTEAFYKRSNYDRREMAMMKGLNRVGLCRRSKAVLKPSGAPKQ